MSSRRVVIFGGSFDPIHVGHVSLAAEVCRQGLAAEVWFMVSPQNPHKQQSGLTDEYMRLEMVRLAIDGMPQFKASDFEFGLPRPSFTINTLSALEKAYPDTEFLLLIGSDNWEVFGKWYKADEILSRYGIIVYPRGNGFMPQLPEGVRWLDAGLYDISSTEVRAAVASGEDIAAMVAPGVADYIKKKGLYKV